MKEIYSRLFLASDVEYWKIHNDNWTRLCSLFQENIELIEKEAQEYDTGRYLLNLL